MQNRWEADRILCYVGNKIARRQPHLLLIEHEGQSLTVHKAALLMREAWYFPPQCQGMKQATDNYEWKSFSNKCVSL